MTSLRTEASGRPIADLLAPPALLIGPLVHFLSYHGYPLARPEVFLLVGVALLVGISYGWFLRLASPELRLVLVSALLLIVIDLLLDLGGTARPVLIALAVCLFVWVTRRHVTSIVLAVGLAFLLATLLVPAADVYQAGYSSSKRVEVDRELPGVFHIILDEHIGVDGIPSQGLRDELVSAYVERGFRVFTNSYSHYRLTQNSLPNLLNYTVADVDGIYVDGPVFGRVLENRHFAVMAEKGYRIRVYQPDYLDFCQAEGASIASCFTYPVNTVGYMGAQPMPVLAKTHLVGLYFLANQSTLFSLSAQLYRSAVLLLETVGVSLPAWTWAGDRVTPPISVVTDRLLADIGGDSRGEYVFAHFLMPHYPYMYDADCIPNRQVRNRLDLLSPDLPAGVRNTEEGRHRRYELYQEQVRCVLKQLRHLFDSLESRPMFEDAVVIVQGDHGSRISVHPVLMDGYVRSSGRDYRDTYSTLFTIRAPGIPGGVDSTRISIQELFPLLSKDDYNWSGSFKPSVPFVFIEGNPGGTMPIEPYRP